jgi:hypothetical protein
MTPSWWRSARWIRGAIAAGVLLALPEVVQAWPAPISDAIVRDARRLLPHSLRVALARRDEAIRMEMGRLPEGLPQAIGSDLLSGQLQPETVALVQKSGDGVLVDFKARRVGAGLVRLGALARVPIDLSDPALAPEDGLPGAVREQYYLFLQANLSKMPVVLTDPAALELSRAQMPDYWQALLKDSRAQTAILRAEMLRGGKVVDYRSIDYRSPVFAVASLSYSRAVTAVAATWLAVWREARGDLTLRPKPVEVDPQAPAAAQAEGPAAPPPTSEVTLP